MAEERVALSSPGCMKRLWAQFLGDLEAPRTPLRSPKAKRRRFDSDDDIDNVSDVSSLPPVLQDIARPT